MSERVRNWRELGKRTLSIFQRIVRISRRDFVAAETAAYIQECIKNFNGFIQSEQAGVAREELGKIAARDAGYLAKHSELEKEVTDLEGRLTRAKEEADIREVLRGYGDAFRNMKVDVMKRLWPGMPPNTEQTYRKDFGRHTKQDWQFESDQTIKIDGTFAEATGTVQLVDWIERIGRHETKWSYVIALRKRAGGWEISELALKELR